MSDYSTRGILTSQQEEEKSIHIGNGIQMKECTAKFLNAVFDPFKTTDAARVPDMQKQSSICMRDYLDNFVPTPEFVDTPTYQGVLLFWDCGFNSLVTNAYAEFGNDIPYYRLWVMSIKTAGIYDSNGLTLPELMNASSIMPNNGDGFFNANSSSGLATALRLFAGGIKVLPTIETITSSDTFAVRNFWAGHLTPADISGWMTGATNTNIQEVVRQARNVQEYPNADGVTVRYDPFQYEEQLEFISSDSLNFAEADKDVGSKVSRTNTDAYYFPFVYIATTNSIDSSYTGSWPFKIYASWWFESLLKHPTPIYTMKSPIDINYHKVAAIAGDTDLYNPVTKGHTFRNFLQSTHGFVKAIENVEKDLRPVLKPIVKMIRAKNKQRKKIKRKKNLRKNKQPRGARLAGVYSDGSSRLNHTGPNL